MFGAASPQMTSLTGPRVAWRKGRSALEDGQRYQHDVSDDQKQRRQSLATPPQVEITQKQCECCGAPIDGGRYARFVDLGHLQVYRPCIAACKCRFNCRFKASSIACHICENLILCASCRLPPRQRHRVSRSRAACSQADPAPPRQSPRSYRRPEPPRPLIDSPWYPAARL